VAGSVSAAGEISVCTTGELPELVAKLDAEFVFGRGRGTSLSLRYPAQLSASNLDNIFVSRVQGRVVASIIVKPFQWTVTEHDYAGVMVGMVWTDPARRGCGLASRLLAHVADALRGRADFAVLWTAQPGFYQRAGWICSDCASFGVIEGGISDMAKGTPVDFARVRAIWQRQSPHLERNVGWQPPLPLPAAMLEMFVTADAYSIAGRRDDELYCYEMLGDKAAFPSLLGQMRASSRILYFNEWTGSPAQHCLSPLGVRWKRKPLAMWLPLMESGSVSFTDGWYVPWLDRI